MKNIMLALRQIAEENRDVELVYPVHLSPVVREAVDTYLRARPGSISSTRCRRTRCITLWPGLIWC